MIHEETCLCTRRTLRFASTFGTDVVTQLYCPKCIDRAAEDAIIFEMCEPSMYAGHWGILYNAGELKRLDAHFTASEDYYLSLLISRMVAPEMVGKYGEGGMCRILGLKHGPDARDEESALAGPQQRLRDDDGAEQWPGDVVAGPGERRKGGAGRT